MPSMRFVTIALALGVGLTAGAAAQEDRGFLRDLFGGNDALRTEGPQQGAPPTGRRVPFSASEVQLSFAPLVAETAPAVVNVYATQQRRTVSPFAGDPFFERFFGGGRPREQSSLGSGVVVDAGGLVVTNNHVIDGADAIKVALPDGREFESRLLLKDERVDLAVLKIESDEPFPTIAIGDSDALEVGDLVLAMGNPFGVGQTTTSGIVSALARNRVGISDFGFFIQTDAAINPGNSGGALIDMAGRLIGINTAIYSRGGGSNGIGFAIPSNMVRAVVNAALHGSDVFERPYVGAGFEAVTAEAAEALGLSRPQGALVSSVDPDGPAARAGIRPGDLVMTMNGGRIEHVDALGYRLSTQDIGSTVTLGLLSRGSERDVEVTLAKAPEDAGERILIEGVSPFAGATVIDLSPRTADRLGLPAGSRGVAVLDTERGSPSAQVGFRPKDIVRAVNGVRIDSAETLRTAAGQRTRVWRFTVERDGRLINQTMAY